MKVRPSLSNFIKLYETSIISKLSVSTKSFEQFQSDCSASFSREALRTLNRKDFDLDTNLVTWSEIMEKSRVFAKDEAERRIRKIREEATLYTFEKEAESVAGLIIKRQAESSTSDSERNIRRKVRTTK